MEITTFPLGPLEANGYLLEKGREAVFMDPGGDPAAVVRTLKEKHLRLTHILVTHLHFDHIYGVKELAQATLAPILANPKDEFLLDTEIGRGGFMGLPVAAPFTFEPIEPGETSFLDTPCTVLATPGHSPGSLSFYFPKAGAVFVGDLLFYRSIGRTDFPGGDMDALMRSVREKIFALPPETVVYSGHGPSTTVSDEAGHNPFFQDFVEL